VTALAIALVIIGGALTSLGVLRLTHAAFEAMPRLLASVIIGAGTLVAAFGVALPRFVHERSEPTIALTPEPSDAPRDRTPTTTLRGVVRSAAGAPIAGAKVTLYSSTKPPRVARSAADGTYAFGGLAIGGPYRVAVDYDGAVFQSTTLVPAGPIRLTVAPTTNKPNAIRVRAGSLAIVGDRRGVEAVYAATIDNTGADAYTGGVPLPLLPGALAVDPRSGLDRSQLGLANSVLFSSAPVLPGTSAISYTYAAPMPDDGVDAAADTTFPTSRFDLLVSGNLRVRARGHDNGSVTLGGRRYHRFTWRRLVAGAPMTVRVTPSSRVAVLRTGAIAVGGLVAALIVVFPLIGRRRRGSSAPPAGRELPNALSSPPNPSSTA